MSLRSVTIPHLTPSDLADVKALTKAHPQREDLALRDLLRAGVKAVKDGCPPCSRCAARAKCSEIVTLEDGEILDSEEV